MTYVRETFQDGVASEGLGQVFRIYGHQKAQFAYAWWLENDAGNREHVAVLGVPPVSSARDAVRAAIAADQVRRKGSRAVCR